MKVVLPGIVDSRNGSAGCFQQLPIALKQCSLRCDAIPRKVNSTEGSKLMEPEDLFQGMPPKSGFGNRLLSVQYAILAICGPGIVIR